METIRIGTCVPGQATEKLLPHFVRAGFECVALNFHMEFPEKDLPTYWEKVRPLLEGSPVKVSSIGFYCNALENEGQRKTLEHFIDNAHLFGTDVVTTFAGALEGQPVEKADVYKRQEEHFDGGGHRPHLRRHGPPEAGEL